MKRTLNNKGYSLVELIVVIALIAIGISILSVSLYTVFSTNVRQTASNADALISKGKVSSNYRMPIVYIEIADDGNGNIVGNYYEEGEIGSGGILMTTEVLGSSRVPVLLVEGSDTSGLPITIAFNRGTGRMQKVDTSAGMALSDFSVTDPQIVFGGAGTRYIIDLVPLTGVHTLIRG